MAAHYLVVRESDAQQGTGAVHVGRYSQEGMARQEADTRARARPGVRYSVYRLVDTCEAIVSPPEWDHRTDTEGGTE